MKFEIKKKKKVILLVGILGIFSLMDFSIGIWDIFSKFSILGISSLIFGSLLISLGILFAFSAYGIWNDKEWGYILALLTVFIDIASSLFLVWKISQPSLFLDVIIDLCLIAGILYVRQNRYEDKKS